MRFAAGSIAILVLTMSTAAQAEIVLGDRSYPDRDEHVLREYCAGLDSQSRQSLISDVPDDVYSGDLGSAYQLAGLPFDVRDCRDAGLI